MSDVRKRSVSPAWLRDAVFYEIYPQSYYDANGDGIGDFAGITEKLPYIRSLGCNALWINPCFDSPFRDAGYDVRDYKRAAPRYGTNEDLYRLFEEAHRQGIRVLLDLVPGHTSEEHPWFLKSGEDPVEYTTTGGITNETRFEARPLIRVYGTGALGIGTETVTITENPGYIDIDCEMMDAFYGAVNCNSYITLSSGKFPVLAPGYNGIEPGAGITKVIITPRWWIL